MTRNEIKELIGTMKLAYPNYNPENITKTIDVWLLMLEEYSYKECALSLKSYIANNTSGFAPSISQIIDGIHTTKEIISDAYPTETEAWDLVDKALSNGNYHAQEEYDKLPELIKKTVGSANMIKMWAQVDREELETVVQSNFMRSYRENVKRAKTINRMPTEIKNQIEQKNQELLESHV